MKDFFISYTRADKAWAEWIAWQLEKADYSLIIQAWDFHAGSNFVLEMQRAATEARRTVAVLSPHFLNAIYTQPEWAAAFADDPTGTDRKLLPVCIEKCELKGMLKAIVYIDLVGKNNSDACDFLLHEIDKALTDARGKPATEPAFPATISASRPEPRFPGSLPPVWKVPFLRNPNFTGREQILADLHTTLAAGKNAAVTQPQAIHGLGGIGKTQIALEYAHRHKNEYACICWLNAEEPQVLAGEIAELAHWFDLPEKDTREQDAKIDAVLRWFGSAQSWLLIFDNVEKADAVRPFVPQGGAGHVILTSRSPNWRGLAQPLSVEVLDRDESVAFLRQRSGCDDEKGAHEVAEALGDLPLALEQAAAYMEASALDFSAYLKLFTGQRKRLLKKGQPPDYPETVATAWEMAFLQLKNENKAAIELLNLCAFLAPQDIPLELFTAAGDKLPASLQKKVADPLAWQETLALLRRYALIDLQDNHLNCHRLVQAVTRDRLPEKKYATIAEKAVELVNAVFPSDTDPLDYRSWPDCERLLPHGLSVTDHAARHGLQLTETATLQNQMALFLQSQARYAAAELLYRRALKIDEKVRGFEHEAVAIRLNNLANLLQDKGDLIAAEPLYRRALAIDENALGQDHPDVAIDLNNLAGLLRAKGDLTAAEPLYRRALEIGEKTLGPDHPKIALRLNNLAGLLRAKGELTAAEPLYRRALEIGEKTLGPDHPKVALRLNNLAGLLQDKGDLNAAEPLYRRALEIDEKALGQDHPDVAIDLNNLAGLLQDKGDLTTVEPLYRRALEIVNEKLGADHPSTQTVQRNLQSLLGKIKGGK
ncbi:MAG: TIR domain-containing protein [Calditrichaeota bacterium]|nr:MAG: TIR domain-containing protein [Calditrichota bacterium]